MLTVFSKLLTFGVVVSVCVGGAVLPASAATSEGGTQSNSAGLLASDIPIDDELATAQGGNWLAGGTLKMLSEKFTVGAGKKIERINLDAFNLVEEAENRGMAVQWSSSATNTSAKAAYRISSNGALTNFWLQTHIYNGNISSRAYAECDIFEGEPGTAGAKEPTSRSQIQCETTRDGASNDWTFSVDTEGGSWIAGGTLKVQEGIDLGPGKKVENVSTTFFNLPEDSDHKPTGMRVEWRKGTKYVSANAAYRIRIAGEATDYWLLTHIFTADDIRLGYARCAVYQGEPGTEEAKPVESSPFRCETSRRSYDNDWDFTLSGVDGPR